MIEVASTVKKNEVWETWAPTGGEWSLWARPVLFAQMDDGKLAGVSDIPASAIQMIKTPEFASDAAMIVDLPGADSVTAGLALALKGYRPVPLYNGCTGAHEVVDQSAIMEWLAGGARLLGGQWLKDAPPAFLLDSWRMTAREVRPGDFDNRWRIFPQDFPAAEMLVGKGIRRVVLIRKRRLMPAADLVGVLTRWQAAGIRIEAFDMEKSLPPTPFVVKLPWWSKSPWRHFLWIFGLGRGAGKGFGHIVPEPRQG